MAERIVNPMTGVPVFSEENPAPVTVVSTGTGAAMVQGTAAPAAAPVGNPVWVAFATTSNSTIAVPRVSSTSAATLGTGTSVALEVNAWGINYPGTGATGHRTLGDANGTVVQSGLSSTFWNYAAATGGIDNSATAVTLKAAGAAGVRNYLKTLHIAHDVLGAATEIAIRDGAAGTVLWRGKLQTAANEGFTVAFDPPLKGTAATLMEFLTISAVTGDVLVNASGYTGS